MPAKGQAAAYAPGLSPMLPAVLGYVRIGITQRTPAALLDRFRFHPSDGNVVTLHA